MLPWWLQCCPGISGKGNSLRIRPTARFWDITSCDWMGIRGNNLGPEYQGYHFPNPTPDLQQEQNWTKDWASEISISRENECNLYFGFTMRAEPWGPVVMLCYPGVKEPLEDNLQWGMFLLNLKGNCVFIFSLFETISPKKILLFAAWKVGIRCRIRFILS